MGAGRTIAAAGVAGSRKTGAGSMHSVVTEIMAGVRFDTSGVPEPSEVPVSANAMAPWMRGVGASGQKSTPLPMDTERATVYSILRRV